VSPDPARSYNTSLLFDRRGMLAAVYRKIHLYDVDIPRDRGGPDRRP
jgi:predicted amidohydrolase